MKRLWKKTELLILVAAVFFLLHPAFVRAEEETAEADAVIENAEDPEELSVFDDEEVFISDENPDADIWLYQYLDSELLGVEPVQPQSSLKSISYNGGKLTGINVSIYNSLKTQVEAIAAGNADYTRITAQIEPSEFTGQKWTAADFGLDSLGEVVDGRFVASTEFKQAFCEKTGFAPYEIYQSLLRDCPYEMYWSGLRYSFGYPYSISRNGGELIASFSDKVTFSIFASPDYAVHGEGTERTETYTDANGNIIAYDPYHVDLTKTALVNAAISNAESIVYNTPYLEDYDKLYYYFDTVSALSDYNYEAAGSFYPGDYGDPWQIIYLFDGDPSTKVVCEGYAKGLQYLCDMTSFNTGICCFSVTGGLYSKSGTYLDYHMWNIVRMDDGRNYLIDITNRPSLNEAAFLSPYSSGSVEERYTIDERLHYSYDADTTLLIYSEEELTLSAQEYHYPTGITLRASLSEQGANLTWTDGQAEDGYTLYKSADGETFELLAVITDAGVFSYTDPVVEPDTVQFYQIVPFKNRINGEKTGMPSPVFALSTITAPTISSVKNLGASINLTWTQNARADGYVIQRKIGDGAFKAVKNTKDASLTSWNDAKALDAGTKYTYRMRAYRIINGVTYYSAFSAPADLYRLRKPKAQVLENNVHAVTVRWEEEPSADGYVIYRSVDGGSYKAVKSVLNGGTTSWNDTKAVVSGSKYRYRMRSFINNQGNRDYSPYSQIVMICRLNRPVITKITAASDGVSISWSEDPGAGGYILERRDPGGSYKEIKTITGASKATFKDRTATAKGKQYSYRIRSFKTANGVTYFSKYSAVSKISR